MNNKSKAVKPKSFHVKGQYTGMLFFFFKAEQARGLINFTRTLM